VRTNRFRQIYCLLTSVLAAVAILSLPAPALGQSVAPENEMPSQSSTPQQPEELETQAGAIQTVKGLEEIVVTARKRTENLQEVPISISAFSAEQLRDRNIQTGYDVALATPNFSFSRNLGRRLDAPIIRGQFSPLISDTEPNASFFIDGVYVPQNSSGNISIENLERVEVLRGPQAALLGRATFAGAVNYITRAPTNEFEGEINLKYGEDQNQRVSAWASGPIVPDKLLYFGSVNFQSRDGQWRNHLEPGALDASSNPFTSQDVFFGPNSWRFNDPLQTDPACPSAEPGDPYDPLYPPPGGCPSQKGDNSPVGGEETKDMTLKLVFDATDNLQFMAKGQWYRTDDEHIPSLRLPIADRNCFRTEDLFRVDSNGDPDPFPGDPAYNGLPVGDYSPGWLCGKADLDGLNTQVNLPHLLNGVQTGRTKFAAPAPFIGAQEDGNLYTLQGIYDVQDWSFTARATSSNIDSAYTRDLDRSYGLGPTASGLFESYEENYVDDKSFEFRVASPQDARISGLIGYYYYDREETDFQRDFTGFSRYELTERFTKETTNNAVFGNIDIDLSDQWAFAIDARYAADEIRVVAAVDPEDPDEPCNIDPVQCKDETEIFYSFTPRFTLTWQPRDELNFYGLAAKGNKPGGFNTDYFDTDVDDQFFQAALGEECDQESYEWEGQDIFLKPGCAKIEEEEAWTYEIGGKTTWFNSRLLVNLSLFYIDWENQAINVNQNILVDQGLELNLIVDNAGNSNVKGAELEMMYAATDDLMLTLNYGLAKTELEEYNSDEFARLTGLDDPDLVNGGNVSGNESPRTPEHSVNLAALYSHDIRQDLSWFARTDFTWESKKWATVSNLLHTGETSIWNARIGIENDRLTLTFYVDNILDDGTPTLIQNFPLFDMSKVATTAPIGSSFNPANYRLIDPSNNQLVYPSGLQYTPRYGTNYGVLVGVRF
jgi:outer membrane receptor protein involved in Fe transport